MTFQYDNRTNQLQIVDSGANASATFQSKGTGAINFAPGSSGLNLSNGGTVTAITRTAGGSGYTTVPSIAITAPTTAGGVQATASAIMQITASISVAAGGTGYTVGDALTASGGTSTGAVQFTVATVSAGVVTGVTLTGFGQYTVLPSPASPLTMTGGTGTGCTINVVWAVSAFTITNAGSGYVEQPTVTFSGGGGSGATAYATVGSGTTVKSVGSTMSFSTPGGEQFRVTDAGATAVDYVQVGGAANASPWIRSNGASTNSNLSYGATGNGSHLFYTSGLTTNQMRITHTASAVNYVQVTGAAAGAGASALGGLLMTGSDASPSLAIGVKGTGGYIAFYSGAATNNQAFRISAANASNTGNLLQVSAAASTYSPVLSTLGFSDSNVGMVLRPQGTGAIDLAAGSSGVNISNGTTVTAITRTAQGSAYTSPPSVAISAPTTAGGVQATASCTLTGITLAVAGGGTGYTAGDVLTLVGGTGTAQQIIVSTVSGGVITAVTGSVQGAYTVVPTNPISVTGGTGSGATINITSYGINSTLTITNAGSGYVEQPTVTFSGGGGSGAAAYASIGSTPRLSSLANTLDFYVASSVPAAAPAFQIQDGGGSGTYIRAVTGPSGAFPAFFSTGGTNVNMAMITSGTGEFRFSTSSGSANQFRVTHTASAVNYVQVTGGATGVAPTISSQGSDANIPLTLLSKGNNGIVLQTRGGGTPRTSLQLSDSGSASVNYMQVQSNIAGAAPVLSVLGTDTNIGMAFQSKGTGAIDLAAGSSGVNISNGTTVTAITRTAAGSNYTSAPSIAISAPTTAGGVQATATCTINIGSITIVSGGTGYTVGDTLTLSGGTFTTAATATVSSVSGGVITAVTTATNGSYTVAPSNPASVTGGTGSGATVSFTTGITSNGFTITNAGSGYVEQPTVTFSGGGGSGAAAYASIGSNPVIKGLAGGSSANGLTFANASGNVLTLLDGLVATPSTLNIRNSGNSQIYPSSGTLVISGGTSSGAVAFYTNGVTTQQFQVAHTASAVNYVQVTGAATGSGPTISAQGSDANARLNFVSKGGSAIVFQTRGGGTPRNALFLLDNGAASVNYVQIQSTLTANGPIISAEGSDTNIDLALTPKGTGYVQFGTYTGTALTIAGYVEIKDSSGTVRKLAVVA